MHLPELESLRCFNAAATHLNFRVAARQVALSPPAFSDRIRRLEDTLGAKLFSRSTRKVALTPEGEALLPQSRRVLEEAAKCAAVVKDRPARTPFALNVGTRWELGLSWLTPSLDALREARPERALHLYFADTSDMFNRLREGRLDCAVTSARITSSWIRYSVLHEESYALVASPKLLKRTPLRGARDAGAHTLVDVHPDLPLFRYFLDACPPGQVWGFGRHEFLGTIAAVRARVVGGAAIGVLPTYFIREDVAKKRVVRLFPSVTPVKDFFRLVWRDGHPHEPELRELAETLRKLPLR